MGIAFGLPAAGFPFLLLYPAVVISAYLGGRDAGLAATMAGAMLAAGYMLEMGSAPELHGILALLLFVATGSLSSLLLSRLKHVLRAVEIVNGELRQAHARAISGEQDKDILLHELVHRVRNELTNISAILQLQARELDEMSAAPLRAAADRIQVLARVHKRLLRDGHTPVVKMQEFLEELSADLGTTMIAFRPIILTTDIASIELPASRAVPTGLIVHELLTNALKYAFPQDRPGKIWMTLRSTGGVVELHIEDNGVGMSAATARKDSTGLGKRLITSLAAQVDGSYHCESDDAGTRCRLTFPSGDEEVESLKGIPRGSHSADPVGSMSF